jgi:3-oxoacyl-[acyl-carrier-protein] synthase II
MTIAMSMPNGCSAMPGIKYGLTGPNMTIAGACSAGTLAIGHGFKSVVQGECDAALVGGAEYLGDDFGGCFRGFDIAGTLVQNCGDPATANRPFDRDRSGFLLAEGGGAMFVIEEKSRALKRGAPIYAAISGFGQSFDAHSMMAMEPDGRAAERMVRSALDEAGIGPADVGYVNAHGTGTRSNDEIESALIERLFGTKPLVNSTKSLTGHTIGASGAIGAAITALSLFHQATHVSKNIQNPVRDLAFVNSVGHMDIRHALTQSFAFGGHNACLILSRYEK